MNIAILEGRMTKDPELKFLPGKGTAVVSFSLAIDRDGLKDANGNKITDFINVIAWNAQAENTAKYCSKGSLVSVVGRIQPRSYDAQDGTKRYVTEINANHVNFLDTKNSNNKNNSNQNNYSNQGSNSNQGDYDFGSSDITPIDDGDIPF